jgi:aminoglycoside phosphotransferase (APT) family kinase protein
VSTTHQIAPDDIVRTAGEVSGREPLVVVEPLLEFLDANGLGEGEPEFSPIGEGHSNVTYDVRRGDARFVLRRPPRGPLPPSAHDMLREARVLSALHGRARVPEVLAVCDDASVIGAPFYVMEFVDSVVAASSVPEPLDTPEERRRMSEELVDALVEMHAVDWREAGLEGFGKPTGYLERQVRRFTGLWEHNRTRELPAVERVGRWLADNMPESGDATVVHGDFRLGNVMFAPQAPARLVAIVDWEMSTIGDPLADLGYLTTFWFERDDPSWGLPAGEVTRGEGFFTRDDILARYEERSGRSMSDARWYQVLALWKIIVFMEGNYRRAVSGSTDDPYLKAFGETIVELGARAEEATRG